MALRLDPAGESLKDSVFEWCRVCPVALFLAIAVLPSFAFAA
jgi:hypothetical protein